MKYIISESQHKRFLKFLNLISEGTSNEEIAFIAKKYNTPTEFRRGSQYAAKLAKERGIWDQVTSHMTKRPQIRYSKDDIFSIALKYDNLKDFIEQSHNAYRKALRLGILDDVTRHMQVLGDLTKRLVYAFEFPDNYVYIGLTHNIGKREKQHQDRGTVSKHLDKTGLTPKLRIISDDYIDAEDAQKMEACTIEKYKADGWNILNKAKAGSLGMCKVFWTKERVKDLTSRLSTWTEFKKNYSGAFDAADRNGWLKDSEITGHLIKRTAPRTEQDIFDIASKYPSYQEFYNNEKNKAYYSARMMGILSKVRDFYNNQ